VAIVVARATKQVKVPGVVGEERREAVEALREAGFGPFVEEEETSDETKIGFVLSQSPKGGEATAPGSEVIVTVGKRASAARLEEEELEGG
jgi:beta-lactam-binding protein with PASTA domain